MFKEYLQIWGHMTNVSTDSNIKSLIEERELKIAYPEYFGQKNVQKRRDSNVQMQHTHKKSLSDQVR